MDNLSDENNKNSLEHSQTLFTEYVKNEIDFMYKTFYASKDTSEYNGYGNNYFYEAPGYEAELYKSRCNKLYEYIEIIKGEIHFYHDDVDMNGLYSPFTG